MTDLSAREKQAIINSLVTLMLLARNSLSPTQTKMAKRSAGELLWLLKIDEITRDGITYVAAAPEGETVDLSPTLQLVASASTGGGDA